MPVLVTIGVYGFDAPTFFAALQAAQVDLFCDIRRRRGVRGAAYAFANSKRLQDTLAGLGIRYVHRPELAPDAVVRSQQTAVDAATHVAKRVRTQLSTEFVAGYNATCLADFDSAAFIAGLENPHVVALFCVEREPAACHRSLLAARLHADLGLSITHVIPPS
ncbi:MAG: DUF488 domain-containing protein [Anaerolineales bacterium]|nr:DUF488 domain-containing protein [Anaerolineales bacterium]